MILTIFIFSSFVLFNRGQLSIPGIGTRFYTGATKVSKVFVNYLVRIYFGKKNGLRPLKLVAKVLDRLFHTEYFSIQIVFGYEHRD